MVGDQQAESSDAKQEKKEKKIYERKFREEIEPEDIKMSVVRYSIHNFKHL